MLFRRAAPRPFSVVGVKLTATCLQAVGSCTPSVPLGHPSPRSTSPSHSSHHRHPNTTKTSPPQHLGPSPRPAGSSASPEGLWRPARCLKRRGEASHTILPVSKGEGPPLPSLSPMSSLSPRWSGRASLARADSATASRQQRRRAPATRRPLLRRGASQRDKIVEEGGWGDVGEGAVCGDAAPATTPSASATTAANGDTWAGGSPTVRGGGPFCILGGLYFSSPIGASVAMTRRWATADRIITSAVVAVIAAGGGGGGDGRDRSWIDLR